METGAKKWYDFSTLLRAQWGIRGELPTWDLAAGYTRDERRQSAYLYPYYRHQQLTTNTLSIAATRNLLTRQGVWSFTLNAAYQKGSGEPYQDGTFTPQTSDVLPLTSTMPAFLYREYQYLVAPQYLLGVRVKYAFLFPGTRLKTHVRLGLDYRKATGNYDYILGSQHTQLSLALGCTF